LPVGGLVIVALLAAERERERERERESGGVALLIL